MIFGAEGYGELGVGVGGLVCGELDDEVLLGELPLELFLEDLGVVYCQFVGVGAFEVVEFDAYFD